MNKEVFKSKSWLYLLMAVMFALCLPLASCSEDDDDYTEPSVSVSIERVLVDQTAGSVGKFTIESTRSWEVSKPADATWLTISPSSGKAGTQEVTVTALANTGKARSTTLTIKASSKSTNIIIAQKSVDGTDEEFTTIAQLYEIFTKAVADGKAVTGSDGTVTYTIQDSEDMSIRAVVTSDNSAGNANSKAAGYLQDATAGIAFRTTESQHSLAMGKQVTMNINGLTLQKYKGTYALQLSFTQADLTSEVDGTMPTPIELTIDQLYADGKADGKYESMLVKITGAQFITNSGILYPANTPSTFCYHNVTSCGTNTLSVPVSKYATFKDDNVPVGNGAIMGHAGSNLYQGDTSWYVYPRNAADLAGVSNNVDDRCSGGDPGTGIPATATKISIADVLKLFKDGSTFTADNYIEGEIIANPDNKNTPDFVVYIADATAGITVTIDDKENISSTLPLGAKVQIYAKDLTFKNYNGLIQFGNQVTSKTKIVERTPSVPLQPVVATMDEILSGKYLSQLVAIDNTQFENADAKYSGTANLFNGAGKSLPVYTRSDATFANDNVMTGSGKFIGVVTAFTTPQLLIRKADDLSGMTGPRFEIIAIDVDKPTLTFTAAGGTETVNVTTTTTWTAQPNVSWCKVSPSGSQTGNVALTVTVDPNTGSSRVGSITISDGKSATAEIKINQAGQSSGSGNELFISEYVEGTSFEKYIEIYNPTNADIDLSAYKFMTNTNGANGWSANSTYALSGTIAPKSVKVYRHNQAARYPDAIDVGTAGVNFNGNDPFGLFKGETLIDIIGVFNGGAADFAKDVTLRRKSYVTSPSDTYIENDWEQLPVNDVSGLGSHTMD